MVQDESSVAVVDASGARVQGSGATSGVDPAGWTVTSKSTVPRGGLLVPVGSVSVTVTVHSAGLLAGVVSGQSTSVEVARAVTVMVSVSELVAWTEAGAGW